MPGGPRCSRSRLRREARAIRRAVGGTNLDPEVLNDLSSTLILELFSGTGRLARCLVKKGFSCKTFDITDDPSQDILDDKAFASLCQLVRSGRLKFVWIGIPCCTWSRARRPGWGPPPLRSDFYLLGYPDLRGKNRAKVRAHNQIMYRTAELVRLCKLHGVRYAVENPDSSRIWLTKPMQRIIDDSIAVTFDFCQYGERWRKRTMVITDVRELADLERLCSCSGRCPECSRTGTRHLQLSGIDPKGGMFKTLLACPYPKQLVRRVSDLLVQALGG